MTAMSSYALRLFRLKNGPSANDECITMSEAALGYKKATSPQPWSQAHTMPLIFSLVWYTADYFCHLLRKVVAVLQPASGSTYLSTPCLASAISLLHETIPQHEVSHAMDLSTSHPTSEVGSLVCGRPTIMSHPPIDVRGLISQMSMHTTSTNMSGGSGNPSGKKQSRKAKRSDSENYSRSTKYAHDLSGDDASDSALSWTTSSTIETTSDLDHMQHVPIQGAPQLLPDRHILDHSTIPPPMLTCRFWFLECSYTSHDEREWRDHNLAHFRGHMPPASMTCPLCDMTFNIPNPGLSWAANMSHLIQHFKIGDSLEEAMPEYVLIRHLWSKHIISDADYQELVSYRRRREMPYVAFEGRDRRNRRGYPSSQSRI